MISKQERVRRGAALLDKTMPGWARKIKLRRLNMGMGEFAINGTNCGCIGAQLADSGEWEETMQQLEFTGRNNYLLEARHGFTAYENAADDWSQKLTELWKDEVRARR